VKGQTTKEKKTILFFNFQILSFSKTIFIIFSFQF